MSRKYSIAGELTLDEYDKLFESMRELGWLSIGGGEPTLRKDLSEIVIHASQRCRGLLGFDFSTNGLIPSLPVRILERILGQTTLVAEIAVSLDGPPDLHDFIRGQEGNWTKCIETYRQLKALSEGYHNLGIHFNYTMSGFNTGKMPEFFDALRETGLEIGAEDISVSFAHIGSAFANFGNDEFMITDRAKAMQDLNYFLSQYSLGDEGFRGFQIWRHTTKKIFLTLARDRYFRRPNQIVIPCAALHASCFMDARGNIYPCTIWPEKVGSLREADFNFPRIWNSERAREIRKRIRSEKCVCRSWSGCESTQSIMVGLPGVLRYAS